MDDRLRCAECGVEMTVADADHAVKTDAGPVHRECFQGPVPPGSEIDELELMAENERRRDHNDVLIDPSSVISGYRTAEESERIEREDGPAVNSNHPGGPTKILEDLDTYEPGDRRVEQMEREPFDEGGYQ